MESHSHSSADRQEPKRILVVLALTAAFMGVEFLAGWLTGSLALWADAGHMLTDVAALSLSAFALHIARRQPTADKTYGYYRAEILAAVMNGALLLALSSWIVYEAFHRLFQPGSVPGVPVLIVGMAGLGVNLTSAKLLAAASHTSLNIRSAYLEVWSDAITSVGVIVGGAVIWLTGWYPIDALVSIGIGLFIVWRTWRLLSQAVNILMEAVPPHLNAQEIGDAMASVAGVKEVHDLHIWTITSGRDALSAHVIVANGEDRDQALSKLQHLLREQFHIGHMTLQMVKEVAEPIRPPQVRFRSRQE